MKVLQRMLIDVLESKTNNKHFRLSYYHVIFSCFLLFQLFDAQALTSLKRECEKFWKYSKHVFLQVTLQMHVNSPTDPSCTSGKPLKLLRLPRPSINYQVTVLLEESTNNRKITEVKWKWVFLYKGAGISTVDGFWVYKGNKHDGFVVQSKTNILCQERINLHPLLLMCWDEL